VHRIVLKQSKSCVLRRVIDLWFGKMLIFTHPFCSFDSVKLVRQNAYGNRRGRSEATERY
jgi:hypothetical protein